MSTKYARMEFHGSRYVHTEICSGVSFLKVDQDKEYSFRRVHAINFDWQLSLSPDNIHNICNQPLALVFSCLGTRRTRNRPPLHCSDPIVVMRQKLSWVSTFSKERDIFVLSKVDNSYSIHVFNWLNIRATAAALFWLPLKWNINRNPDFTTLYEESGPF